jgi:serine/threonine protein kinase
MTPSNVFILSPTPEFPSLRSKLLDFGIAKHLATETRITTTGAIIGSPAYMSPEQARSEVVGVTSDLWSLGAVIFRCVTGVDAFQGKNLTEVLINICTGEAPRATLVSPELPNELNEFFERAFARNSNFRFGSALEMNAAFSQIIQSVPETNETVIGADDMSSTVRRFSQIPRTNTATILATQYPPKGWLRRTATSRRAIVGLSLAFGGIFGILATKGRGINNSHQSLPSFGSSTATTSTRLAPQSEKTSSNFVTERPSTPTIMSSSELAATTTQLPKVGTVRLRKKPSTPVSRTSSDIDPIFGLPEADK